MTAEPRTLRGMYEELVLRPLIERTLEILTRRGLIPPPPPEWKAERDEEKAILLGLGEDNDAPR